MVEVVGRDFERAETECVGNCGKRSKLKLSVEFFVAKVSIAVGFRFVRYWFRCDRR